MKRFYNLVVSLIILFLSGIQVQAQYTSIGGTMADKTQVLSTGYLQTLDTELKKFATDNGYTIFLNLNTEILDPKGKKNLTPQSIQSTMNERRTDLVKDFKKQLKDNPKIGKGVVINLDILFKNAYDTSASLESYFMQTLIPGPRLNTYAKTGLGDIPQTNKLKIGTANQTVNQQAVQATIDKIKTLFLEAKQYPADNFLFGPLKVSVSNPVITNASGYFKKYTCTKDTLKLSLLSTGYEDMQATIVNAAVSFLYNDATGEYKNVVINRPLASDPIFTGHQAFLNIYLTAINITIEPVTGINGTVTLNTLTDRDIELQNLLVLKKGFGGSFQFTYSNSTDFAGSYNFAGLINLEVDFIKDHQTIALAKGTVDNAGTVHGTLATTQAVTVHAANFTMDVQNLNIQFDFSVKDGVHITSGSLNAVFSGIPGFSGNIPVTANYDQYGNIAAGLQTNGLTLSVCGMQIVNPALNLVLDNNLDIITIEGSAKIKHSDFNTPVTIDQLRWSNDRGIEIFTARGTVEYKGFSFELKTFQYNNGLFNVSARVELNTAGTTSFIDVTSFTIAEDGSVDIGAISGEIKAYLVDFDFQAEFGADRFIGGFTGKIAGLIQVEGAVDVGQFKPASGASYTFCYLKIVVSSNSAGIPLAPLPIKLTSIGGEYGYNYFIDYQHIKNPDRGPQKGNYLIGLTLGVSDVTGSIGITGNPVAQLSNSTASFNMSGTIKVPSNDPWFSMPIQAGFTLPEGDIYGSFNVDFKVPKTTGSIINTSNLGLNFLFKKTDWYVGRKGMNISLFNALELGGDLEFSGNYTNPSAYKAYMATRLALDWSWSGTQNVSILDYNLVKASASLALTLNANSAMTLTSAGVSGSFTANMSASGSVDLSVCPDCNWDWTTVHADVNAQINAGIEFQNTQVRLHGNGLFQATVLSKQGTFTLAIDYTFDPTRNGSGTTTVAANTEVRAVPVSAAPFKVPSSMPAKGVATAATTKYNQEKAAAASNPVKANTNTNFVTSLDAYSNIRTQLTASSSKLAAVEGASVLETKLKSSGAYVLTNLNNESVTNSNMLIQYAKYVKANPGTERTFATDRPAFDSWFTQAKSDIALLSAPTTLSSYPTLKANLTASTSLLQSVEGVSTLQSKLQASGGYVMSKLNAENAAILVDYAKFLKANSAIENTFKSDNYAFDAWLKGAKSSAGTNVELTDADMSAGLVGIDGGAKELTYAGKVVAPANTIDIIIHAVGSTYKFEVNGAYIPGDHRVLASWLKTKGYNTKTIRLLSCSDLTSAQNLCNKLNQPVIATDGYVCIYSDGGLSVVPREGNGSTKWYLLKPNAVRNETTSPRAPGSPTLDYVQMGGSKSEPANSEVANATQQQLEALYQTLALDPPYDYTPNTLEHKADRWAQYKEQKSAGGTEALPYSQWSNKYNANMNKANKSKQVELDYMSSIGWGEPQVTVDVLINGKLAKRRLDIADDRRSPTKAIEVKAYETGVVYATENIKTEVMGDAYLINSKYLTIEWVFIGCTPSGPLNDLLIAAGIKPTILP